MPTFCYTEIKEMIPMGSPKGKKHRVFTKEEKLRIVKEYLCAHETMHKFGVEHNLNISVLRYWVRNYSEKGEEGLASYRDKCGNKYSALHTSNSLDEMGKLELRMLKLETDLARLKKGYLVKGSGSQKEYVTGSGKIFKLSKN